jgi:hypothetical protein
MNRKALLDDLHPISTRSNGVITVVHPNSTFAPAWPCLIEF